MGIVKVCNEVGTKPIVDAEIRNEDELKRKVDYNLAMLITLFH
jgi:hypothetical protein